MLFSIITPCYNSEKTIARTLNSVLNQTFKDFEYIIIDGGSTDKTLDIINGYRNKFKNNLTVISEPDEGIYDAMNKGIRMAKGNIVGIVNSDDYYEPKCLKVIADHYDAQKPLQIIYGMMRVVNERQEELAIRFNHHRNMEKEIINHPASFVTKKLYEKCGCYDIRYKSAADFDFMLKMIKKDVYFTPVYEIVTNFTRGGMSGTYIGVQEDNEVRYNNGLVGRKKYLLTKWKNTLKYVLGV
ncbi:glycosyltransferase family 2 protein [Anaerovibrio lipolyticus]|uniref:glycosyltransferase family 2 protein n=1 Tax=Anaerovibrio lipolyticus TaxID=82374 RepID=UPI000688833D|nr:glycosyltransferase family 2 protein [Anaerovibrio lipolyticus]